MSLRDRISRSVEGLEQGLKSPQSPAAAPDAGPARAQAPKTAPGQMLAVHALLSQDSARLEEAERRLAQYEGSSPAKLVDARRVRASPLANRHPSTYRSAAFNQLKAEIQATHGNVQPVKVRPINGDPAHDFELVFGHRRHRACQDLNQPLFAVIEAVDDTALWLQMDAENRGRADLSPYELALHYQRALEHKLWPSLNQLAAAVGLSQPYLSQILPLATLPAEVVEAFASPADIQRRWAQPLRDALARDAGGVQARAQQLAHTPGPRSPKAVFEALVSDKAAGEGTGRREIKMGGRRVAVIETRGDSVAVRFSKGALPPQRLKALEQMVVALLKDSGA